MSNFPPESFFIFDLDDTLYKEIDFVKSGYFEIAVKLSSGTNQNLIYNAMLSTYKQGGNAIQAGINLSENTLYTCSDLIHTYRLHIPHISLDFDTKHLLKVLINSGYKLGLITDGRSNTQRNKLNSLGIEHIFSEIIISEEFGSEKP
mgnify:CR=1 FL=1